MNKKIPFQDLAKKLAEASSISVDSAEVFIKNFFDLISETLINGDPVKIKGLGTFTPGKGENGVDFIPDNEIADTINAPFASFEAVELNDEVTDQMLAETEVSPEEDDSEPRTIEAETEATAVTDGIVAQAINEESDTDKATEATVDHIVENTPQESKRELISETKDEPATEIEPATEREPKSEPLNDTHPLTVSQTEKKVEIRPEASAILEEEPEEFVEHVSDDNSSGNSGFGWGFLVGLIVGLALGACAVYLAIDYLFPYGRADKTEQLAEVVQDEAIIEVTNDESSPADSLPVPQNDETTTTANDVKNEKSSVANMEAIEQEANSTTVPAASKEIVKDTVRRGYSLTHMAKRHYGSKDFWVYIYEENKSKIKNPNMVQPGEVYVIPAPEKYGIDPNNKESISRAKAKAGQIISKFK